MWNRELHTGDIFNLPTRILAAFFSLMLPVLAITGPLIWWTRRRVTKAQLPARLTNPTPGLTSVSPTSAGAGSNITLSVTGSRFVPGAVLLWNGAERTTTFVDSSHLTVAIPASDLGLS